jgi:hypothetical protein
MRRSGFWAGRVPCGVPAGSGRHRAFMSFMGCAVHTSACSGCELPACARLAGRRNRKRDASVSSFHQAADRSREPPRCNALPRILPPRRAHSSFARASSPPHTNTPSLPCSAAGVRSAWCCYQVVRARLPRAREGAALPPLRAQPCRRAAAPRRRARAPSCAHAAAKCVSRLRPAHAQHTHTNRPVRACCARSHGRVWRTHTPGPMS